MEEGQVLRQRGRFRGWFLALAVFPAFLSSAFCAAVDSSGFNLKSTSAPSNIVIGFVGGFVNSDNQHHGPVQLAERIRRNSPQGTYVRVFENRRRKQAYKVIVRLLDADRDGVLSVEERTSSHIILFGHSWGAAAAVLLARDLGQEGIPVSLTVQVDSVAKLWQNDSVIPDNVEEAVNFYQTHGIVHGRREITAADPAKTQIVGNYLVDYRKNPVECPGGSWWDRIITPSHMQSECDPRLWSSIEKMVRERISPTPSAAAITPSDRAVPTR
jgi:pimeloyl-ACP methyl ester carboxylesterase